MKFLSLIMLVCIAAACTDNERYHVINRGMQPTINPDEYVMASGSAYRSVADVKVGDIVVYVIPQKTSLSVRRVVALPGDQVTLVKVDEHNPVIHVNDVPVRPLPTVLWRADRGTQRIGHDFVDATAFPFTVPPNHVLVAGDDPDVAMDSRAFGPLPFSELRGKVVSVQGRPVP